MLSFISHTYALSVSNLLLFFSHFPPSFNKHLPVLPTFIAFSQFLPSFVSPYLFYLPSSPPQLLVVKNSNIFPTHNYFSLMWPCILSIGSIFVGVPCHYAHRIASQQKLDWSGKRLEMLFFLCFLLGEVWKEISFGTLFFRVSFFFLFSSMGDSLFFLILPLFIYSFSLCPPSS